MFPRNHASAISDGRLEMCATTSAPPIDAANNYALFLDLDGTLLEIAERPESVRADDQVKALIARLLEIFGGATALISGRSIVGIDALLDPLRVPIAGQHGSERRDSNGEIQVHKDSLQLLDQARADVTRWALQRPGIQIEDKGLSIALHYRHAPTLGNELSAFLRDWLAAHRGELQVQLGKMVAELKPSGRDKGVAIGDFLREAPFKGRRPIFVGDDLTDEHGFAFVNEHGGISVKVGLGKTVAQHRLADVTAVRKWLEQLTRAKRG